MSRCPKPGKIAYDTQLAAEDARLRINACNGTPQRLSRAYECRCGYWHLTKWEFVSPGLRHLHVAPEALAAPPVPEVKPVAAYAPTDPISNARRAQWAALQGEYVREHLAHPFPWRRAA